MNRNEMFNIPEKKNNTQSSDFVYSMDNPPPVFSTLILLLQSLKKSQINTYTLNIILNKKLIF